jgi:hypothetical protein
MSRLNVSARVVHQAQVIVALILIAAVFWFYALHDLDTRKKTGYGKTDLAVLYVAGASAGDTRLQTPETLLNTDLFKAEVKKLRRQEGGSKYLYPIPSVFLFTPLTALPFSVIWKLWAMVSISAWIAGFYLCVSRVLHDHPFRWRYTALFAALSWSDVIEGNMYSGQVNTVLFLLLVVALVWLSDQVRSSTPASRVWVKRAKEYATGLMLGVVAVVKMFSVGIIPALVYRKQWIALAGMATVMTITLGLSLTVFSPQDVWSRISGFHDQPVQEGAVGFSRESTTLTGSLRADMYGRASWLGFDVSTKEKARIVHKAIEKGMLITAAVVALFVGLLYWRDRAHRESALWILDFTIPLSFILLFVESTHAQYHLLLLPFLLWILSHDWMYSVRTHQSRWMTWGLQSIALISIVVLFFSEYIFPSRLFTIGLVKPGTVAILWVFVFACIYRFAPEYRQVRTYRSYN